jgi:hypothetical protein
LLWQISRSKTPRFCFGFQHSPTLVGAPSQHQPECSIKSVRSLRLLPFKSHHLSQLPTSLINENSYHVLLLNLYPKALTAKRSYILQRKLTSYSTVCGGTQRCTPSRIRPTRVVVATLLHRSLHRAACSQPMVTRVQRAPFSLYPILLSTGLERLTPWSSTLLKNMIPIYSERRSRNIASSSST